MNFSTKLYQARNKAGLSQIQLAQLTGISQVMISLWENPSKKNHKRLLPRESTARKLAEVLNDQSLFQSWKIRKDFFDRVHEFSDEQMQTFLEK